jgi:hypothetical protein
MNVQSALGEFFGDYLAADRLADWEKVKAGMPEGAMVSGKVVHRSHFGVWLDLAVGFPALLEIIFIDGLTPQKYQRDDYYPLETTVSAKVLRFRDSGGQINLMQTFPPTLGDPFVPAGGSTDH